MEKNYNPQDDKVLWRKSTIVGQRQITLRVIQHKDYDPKCEIQLQQLDSFDEPQKNSRRYDFNELSVLNEMIPIAHKELVRQLKEKNSINYILASLKLTDSEEVENVN